jgi:hypothetical protein
MNGRLLDLAKAAAEERPARKDLAELLTQMTGAVNPAGDGKAGLSTATGQLPDALPAFIRGYERLLRVMPENSQRTELLAEMVKKIEEFRLDQLGLPELFHLSDSPGERLAAILGLKQQPDPRYLHWLGERLAVEYAFAGYHAAAALKEAARKLPEDDLERVADAIEGALALLPKTLGKSGRRDKLNEAQSELARRR